MDEYKKLHVFDLAAIESTISRQQLYSRGYDSARRQNKNSKDVSFHLWNHLHSIIVDPTWTLILIIPVYLNLVQCLKLSFTPKPSTLNLIISVLLFDIVLPIA